MATRGDRSTGATARPDRAARREQFLDAAVRVIERDGPGASMEAIATEAGVTKPIVYRVFGDRDGLVTALSERFGGALQQMLEASLRRSQPDGAGPETVLRSTIDVYIALIEANPELYRFLTARLLVRSESAVSTLADEIARTVALVIGDELRARGLDSGAAEPWAFALVGMVHMAGDWWVERRTITRDALVDYLVRLVWDGLAALDDTRRG